MEEKKNNSDFRFQNSDSYFVFDMLHFVDSFLFATKMQNEKSQIDSQIRNPRSELYPIYF